uniref:GOLD domain-containing protein n=1 Tax=Chromera velia CCMP2878 TaxID=1169474 RepID=A0A0G4FLM5_9ALVE|mmetsp:Transcript_34565/g.68331  ORF Transcript_34565/g.68331 Transcript_34565/m.68331 type:complete len:208 (+) Transcript_34565:263-886(+)|eukprot:Cvel_407.t1-p1 / transcript=Cvel_407.t1 / gene=Cvel_407 / organism=Chromera_velia_CCMP2878 / gene_product=Endosomal protein P24B, putative / transcript_product=Endosomal protein P24B, putative / location=Cvel_scaffold13:96413-100297(+) / protein_length=207 / sequence_SO=supercontig / SO=protein_coding / is_pseudo=false
MRRGGSRVFLGGLIPFLVVLSNLPGGTGLFFKLAPNARECFGFAANGQEDIVGSFEAIGGEKSVRVTLTNQQQKEDIYDDSRASHQFRFEKALSGNYQLCFKSLIGYLQTISFSVRVQTHETHPEELATEDDSHRVAATVYKLEEKISEIMSQQEYAITRERIHRNTTESTNARVLWWTIVEMAVLVVLSAFQIYYIRSFFEIKTIV